MANVYDVIPPKYLPKSSMQNPTLPADAYSKVYGNNKPQDKPLDTTVKPQEVSSYQNPNQQQIKISEQEAVRQEIKKVIPIQKPTESESSYARRIGEAQRAYETVSKQFIQREEEARKRLKEGITVSYKSMIEGKTITKEDLKPTIELTPTQEIITQKKEILPPKEVQPAKSLFQSYKSYIKDRNPVTSTVGFIAEKIQGIFGKLEYKYTPNAQSLASTGAISTALQIAPYLTPIGPAYMIAGGTAQVLTEGGRTEVSNVATSVSTKYPIIPQPLVKYGLYGLAVTDIGLGSKNLYKQLSKEIVVGKVKPVITSQAVEVVQPSIKNDIQTSIGSLRMKTDITPGYKIVTNRLRQLASIATQGIRGEPKAVEISKPRTYYTIGEAITTGDELVKGSYVTQRAGKDTTLKKYYQLEGRNVKIEPTKFNTLSQQEKKALQIITPTFTGSEPQIYRLSGESKYIMRTAGKSGKYLNVYIPFETGRKITRSTGISVVEKVASVNDLDIYKGTTGVRDITRIGSKGKSTIQSITYVRPTVSDTTDITKINKGTIQSTRQKIEPILKQLEVSAVKTLPKIKPIPSSSSSITQTITDTYKTAPKIVGGLGREVSQYASKGYTIEEFTQKPLSIDISRNSNIQSNVEKEVQKERLNLKTNIALSTAPTNIQPQFDITKNRVNEITKLNVETIPLQSTSLTTVLTIRPITNTAIEKGKIIITPITSVKKNPSILSKIKAIKESIKSKGYNVLVKRKGKFVKVAENLPKGLATRKGVEVVERTLAASFKLEPSKNIVSTRDISYNIPSNIFRQSKREPDVYVQRKGGKEGGFGRLASRTEVSEIVSTKRRKLKIL